MNTCYWCEREIIKQLDWKTLIIGRENDLLCEECIKELEVINEPFCMKCFKSSTDKICDDCKSWEEYFLGNDPLEKNISTFYYNEFLKEIIAKWKYRGDYILGKIFYHEIKLTIKRYYQPYLKEAVLVPIPLSNNRITERGFNQSELIAQLMTNDHKKIVHLLERVDDEKQSKKSRMERIYTKNPFKLRKTINNSVILVDDIYTTGTTIRHAARLLKENGCPAVYSYTLVRG